MKPKQIAEMVREALRGEATEVVMPGRDEAAFLVTIDGLDYAVSVQAITNEAR